MAKSVKYTKRFLTDFLLPFCQILSYLHLRNLSCQGFQWTTFPIHIVNFTIGKLEFLKLIVRKYRIKVTIVRNRYLVPGSKPREILEDEGCEQRLDSGTWWNLVPSAGGGGSFNRGRTTQQSGMARWRVRVGGGVPRRPDAGVEPPAESADCS